MYNLILTGVSAATGLFIGAATVGMSAPRHILTTAGTGTLTTAGTHKLAAGVLAAAVPAIGAFDEYACSFMLSYPFMPRWICPVVPKLAGGINEIMRLSMQRVVVPLGRAGIEPVIDGILDLAAEATVVTVKGAPKAVAKVARRV